MRRQAAFFAGIGYRDVEFKAFGVPRGAARRMPRNALPPVCRSIVRGLRHDEGFGFRTRPRDLSREAAAETNPSPIWIGANGDVAIRRAARDRRLLVYQPAQHTGNDRAADGACTSGRSTSSVGHSPAELPMRREAVFVAKTRAEAIRLAQPYLEEKYKAHRAWGQDKVMPDG